MGHIRKEYEAKDKRMTKYLLKVQESLDWLDEWAVEKIPRIANLQADALAGIAASLPVKESMLLPIYVQATPTIAESHICNTVKEDQDWTIDIKAYLRAGTLPEDSKHAHKIRMQAACFTLI